MSNGGVDKAVHLPLACTAADIVEERLNHLTAVFGVINLGMELHAVEHSLLVSHCGYGAVIGMSGNLKALWRFADVVTVTHPRNSAFGQGVKQNTIFIIISYGLAVFTYRVIRRRYNISAERICHKLTAVADTQNRDTELKNLRRIMRRALVINAVRSACEYNTLWINLLDFFYINGVGQNLTVHVIFTDAPCD